MKREEAIALKKGDKVYRIIRPYVGNSIWRKLQIESETVVRGVDLAHWSSHVKTESFRKLSLHQLEHSWELTEQKAIAAYKKEKRESISSMKRQIREAETLIKKVNAL